MKSKHESVNLNAMLESLLQSAPVQLEDKVEREDQVLIKSIFQRSREFKKRRFSQQVSDNPTVYFPKTTTDNILNKREDPRGLCSFVFKSSTVKRLHILWRFVCFLIKSQMFFECSLPAHAY
ncbi:hypothetical protein LXL04_008685 [Taraxacum kok-saghyz]